MRALTRAIHAELKGGYGSPRRVRELRAREFLARKERVERRVRDNGIYTRPKRRTKVTTDSRQGLPVADNRLARNFTPTAPNPVWTADITDLWTDEGGLSLAIGLDLFNREVVGRSLKPRRAADIVTDALSMAGFRKKPAPGLRHHADRDRPYARLVFQDKLKEYGRVCSMRRKGNCGDNAPTAPTESGFNRFKNERVLGIRYATQYEMKAVSFEYIEVFYNPKRPHSARGYPSPLPYFDHWNRTQSQERRGA